MKNFQTLIFLMVLVWQASAQTFETTFSLAKYCQVNSVIETKTGFLIAVLIFNDIDLDSYTSNIIEIDKNGTLINTLTFNEHYATRITELFIISDSTYGALAISHYGKDSLAKFEYYALNMATGYQLQSAVNLNFTNVFFINTDICLNKDNNIVVQLAYDDYQSRGYHFFEYNLKGELLLSNQPFEIFGIRACIVPDTSTGYFCFDDRSMHHLNHNFEFMDTYYFNDPNTPYIKITDAIWENDSTLIYSIAVIKDNPVYHLGLSRMRYGTELVNEQRYSYTEPHEMYAYYNSFDTVGNYFYLAATTNFDGYGGVFDKTDTTGMRIIKANKDFSIKWDKTYRRDANNFLYYLIGTSDGGCMVAGTRYDFTQPEERLDLYLLKVDSLGNYTTVGINEQLTAKSKVLVYPNPGQSQLNIDLDDQLLQAKLNLYTLAGTKMLTTVLYSNNNVIETGHLPQGIYIYEIETKNATLSRGKWVKQ